MLGLGLGLLGWRRRG
ncbi:hypothetical protein [Ottowia sp.]